MPPTWLLFALICAFWLFYLVRPLVQARTPLERDRRERLLEEKRGYLFALRDAETDFEAGKISAADHAAAVTRLEEAASKVIAELDAMADGTVSDRVEKRLGELRSGKSSR